ncbi:MAG: hypothetical protein WCC21_10105 [Candidatus Acidiferrales bacterium]
MTNNESNQPFEPFRVQSPLLQNSGRTAAPGRPGSGGPGWDTPFGRFDWHEARWLVMILFALMYWAAARDRQLQPLTVLVLLACLLFKMDSRSRNIGGVPLALAALKLVYQMNPGATLMPGTQILLPENAKAAMTGLPWVPMFLAICIFYLPQNATVTGMIARATAIGLLISGLIPGDGYVIVLAMVQYTLFVGVLVGLIADFSANGAGQNSHRAMPAAQI